jgi:hypothetical protein
MDLAAASAIVAASAALLPARASRACAARARPAQGCSGHPVVVGGGTPFLPPVTEDVPLDLVETRTFGSRVIYERYGRARDESD